MNETSSPLFETLRIGSLSLPSRVFKSAISETRASVDGFVTDEFIAFYEPMACVMLSTVLGHSLLIHTFINTSGKITKALHAYFVTPVSVLWVKSRWTAIIHEFECRKIA